MDDAGGDENVEGKCGRDRIQVVGCKPRVRVYATISRQSKVDSEEGHVRDVFIKFGDSLVQATGRSRKMPEVVPDDL